MKQGYGLWVGITVAAALIAVGLFYTNLRTRKDTEPTSNTDTLTPSPTATATATPTPTPSPSPTPVPGSKEAAAKAAYEKKDYLTAIAQYEAAIKETNDKKTQAALWNSLGNAYRDNKSSTQAMSSYTKAFETDSSFIQAYINLSNLYLSQGNRDKAKATLETGLVANPKQADLERELSIITLSGTEEIE